MDAEIWVMDVTMKKVAIRGIYGARREDMASSLKDRSTRGGGTLASRRGIGDTHTWIVFAIVLASGMPPNANGITQSQRCGAI